MLPGDTLSPLGAPADAPAAAPAAPPPKATPAAAPSADVWCRRTGYRLDSLVPAQHDYRDYAAAPAASAAPAAE